MNITEINQIKDCIIAVSGSPSLSGLIVQPEESYIPVLLLGLINEQIVSCLGLITIHKE